MTAQIRLDPKLDLRGSEALAETLRNQRGEDLELDASAVEHLGAHAVQTLLIAIKSWQDDGRTLTCRNLSSSVCDHLALLGVDPKALSTGPTA